jgi:hypothetical protein
MVCALSLSLFLTGTLWAADYQHSLTVDQMTFDWSVEGQNLMIKLSAPTKGWVGIGFNPSEGMKDANFILGYVKDGKVELSDDFGTQFTKHVQDIKQDGTDDVTVIGGNETGNTTTLEFSIPLKSGDASDGIIDPKADTVVLFAYGPDRDSFRMKHQYHKAITVNLESGSMK